MKKIIFLVILLMLLSAIPMAFASGVGGSFGGDIVVEEFPPMVFQCDNRVLIDDNVQPWRTSNGGQILNERNQQYLFEGERYQVDVLVFDKNKIQDDMVDLVLEGEGREFHSCGAVCRDNAGREIPAYIDKATCEANGICTLPTYTQADCVANPSLVWVNRICTSPTYTTQSGCVNAGGIWDLNTWTPKCIENVETIDDKMINCVPLSCAEFGNQFPSCNARIDEEPLTVCNPLTMQPYRCTIDVLDSEHMYGLYWLKVRATSGLYPNLEGEYAEIARWFINPVIGLSIDAVDGSLDFSDDDVRPGTSSYDTVLLENTAEGGVLLDMFITGKDWPAADDELGRCQNVDSYGNPITGDYVNYIPLGAFRYYAENGAYSTRDEPLGNSPFDPGLSGAYGPATIVRNKDVEGYINIHKQVNAGFEEAMFDDAEIIQADRNALSIPGLSSKVWLANLLYPGSAGMSVTFRLNLPEPCYGNYNSPSTGSVFFWAEAI